MVKRVKRERFSEDELKVSVDRISALPDELLASILCSLSFKEATETSILCGRWRYLHTLTRKLDLDGTESIRKLGRDKINEERSKFVKWVNDIIALHKSSSVLEQFKVFFNLDRSNTKSIDEWLRYALSRKVQTLELNLTCRGYGSREYHECYTFPYKKGNLPHDFNFIKKLSTNHVNVSGEAVALFLRNCPLLELISLAQSGDLLDLEIIETFPSFKCLEISLCHNLKSVVIRDSNIVCVKVYMGKRIQHFAVANVPLLTEIWFAGLLMEDCFDMFSSVLPQIKVFKLYVWSDLLSDEGIGIKNFCSAVEMSNLQKFVVDIGGYYVDGSLLPLINLIRASPRLQRFVLEAPQEFEEEDEIFVRKNWRPAPRKMAKARSAARKIPTAFPYLKELEFVGYRDVSNHFEMVMHFVENAVALENILVDPRGFKFHLDSWWDRVPLTKIDYKRHASASALKKYIPSRINVKIL